MLVGHSEASNVWLGLSKYRADVQHYWVQKVQTDVVAVVTLSECFESPSSLVQIHSPPLMETVAFTKAYATARGFKTSKKTKVGIKFNYNDQGMLVLTQVSPSGMFGIPQLRPGYRIIAVNGISMVNKTLEEVLSKIENTVGEIELQTKHPDQPSAQAAFVAPSTALPNLLRTKGVPESTWQMIIDHLNTDLLPRLNQWHAIHDALATTKAPVLANEAAVAVHTRKMDQLLHRLAASHASLALMGANLLQRAAALLQPYGGVLVQFKLVNVQLRASSRDDSCVVPMGLILEALPVQAASAPAAEALSVDESFAC